jgi:hypothetical protein
MRGGRGASREAGGPVVWWRHTSGMHGDGPTQGLGARARAERTSNMRDMVVTLEVSQPEMSALKLAKSRRRKLMSVMAETSQSAMGPYVAVAAVGLALNAWTAVCREALVVNMPGGDGGGGGDGDEAGGGDVSPGQLHPEQSQPTLERVAQSRP